MDTYKTGGINMSRYLSVSIFFLMEYNNVQSTPSQECVILTFLSEEVSLYLSVEL
jgi:hypothetical protein